jgi:hypothetical protein
MIVSMGYATLFAVAMTLGPADTGGDFVSAWLIGFAIALVMLLAWAAARQRR